MVGGHAATVCVLFLPQTKTPSKRCFNLIIDNNRYEIATMNRIELNFQKFSPRRLALLLMFAFPALLHGQYKGSDHCLVSFRNYPNAEGKLEHAVEDVSFSFRPGAYAWDVAVTNHSDEDIVVDWNNAQFIINGMTSGLICRPVGAARNATTPRATLIGRGMTFNGSLAPSILADNGRPEKIYDSKMLSKNNKRLIVIVIPTSLRGGPRRYNSFDFLIESSR